MKKLPYLLSAILAILLILFFSRISHAQTSFNISNKTNGDTLLTIDNEGHVGIRTTSGVGLNINSGSNELGTGISLNNADGSHYLYMYSGKGGTSALSPVMIWQEGDPMRFASWGEQYNEYMRLSETGNLGIGTTNPSAKFTISGSSGSLNHGESAVFLQNSNRYFDFNGGMIFRGSGMNWNSRFTATDNLGADEEVVGIYKHEATAGDVLNDVTEVIATFKNNGNVGIGTETPTTLLEVADTIYCSSGAYKFPDGTVQETAAGGGLSGNTLDQAYDQGGPGAGATIVADNGPVNISGSGGLVVNGVINSNSSIYTGGSGSEGGQITFNDGDGQGGWIIDNYGSTDNEALRFFRGSGLSNALVINSAGNVGIGTGGPSADLHVEGTDGVLFGGTFGSGSIPAEGEGTRMMWYPAKAAFRSGRLWSASSTFWDIDSIGDYSFAAGFNTRASGRLSTSIGNYTNASGDYSLATCNSTTASGNYSTAMGSGSIASGAASTALGFSSIAIGNGSVAMGNNAEANGLFSIAMGDGTVASNWASIAMGDGTVASGNRSTAMGLETTASGDYSTAMGSYSEAIGSTSTAMGSNTEASGDRSTAMGLSTEASGLTSTAMGRNTIASGDYSTTMGAYTTADGDYSTAMGTFVSTSGNGSFAIGDASTTTASTFSTANQFNARFANGYRLYTSTNLSSGAEMLAGANSWSSISDSTKKENFKAINGEDFLNKISKFNLTSWNYKGQDPSQFRHYGPMAQDFYAAFGNDGIGTIGNDTTLASADFDGINFIAIQALEKRTSDLEDMRSKNKKLENKVAILEENNNDLNNKLAQLENRLQSFEKLLVQLNKNDKTLNLCNK